MISLLKNHDLQIKNYTNKFIKNQHKRFSFQRVEDVCPLPESYCVCWGWLGLNFCLLSICKDLKALSHTLQGWTLSLSCALSPHTDPIQQQHDFPHKPALNTCRSSCQQMSTPICVLLKADHCLEDDVADEKADPLKCLQLSQISVLQYFLETAGSMDHQHVLIQAFFLKKF